MTAEGTDSAGRLTWRSWGRCVGIPIAAVLLMVGGDLRSALASLEQPFTPFGPTVGARFHPIAIYNDGESWSRLEVWRPGGGGRAEAMLINPLQALTTVHGNALTQMVTLWDTGTNGDCVAGDGIYTLAPVFSTFAPNQFGGRVQWNEYVLLFPSDGATVVAPIAVVDDELNYDTRLLGVDGAGNAIVASDYVVAIEDDGAVDGYYLGDFENNHRSVLDKFYGVYGDVFDFVAIWSVMRTDMGANHHIRVRNDVTGIGGSLFDHSDSYGMPPESADRGNLDGVVYLNRGGESVLGAMHHELMHRWGVRFGTAWGIRFGNHWNGGSGFQSDYVADFVGALGGGAVEVNQDGSLQIEANSANAYADIELYLMGLLEAAALETHGIYVIDDAFEGGYQRVEIDGEDMVDTFGPRVPNVGQAQKEFSCAFVVMTPVGDPLSPAEFDLFSTAAEHFGSRELGDGLIAGSGVTTPMSFAAATGFRASIETELPELDRIRARFRSIHYDIQERKIWVQLDGVEGSRHEVMISRDLHHWDSLLSPIVIGSEGSHLFEIQLDPNTQTFLQTRELPTLAPMP